MFIQIPNSSLHVMKEKVESLDPMPEITTLDVPEFYMTMSENLAI